MPASQYLKANRRLKHSIGNALRLPACAARDNLFVSNVPCCTAGRIQCNYLKSGETSNKQKSNIACAEGLVSWFHCSKCCLASKGRI